MNQSIFEYYQKNSDNGFIDVVVIDKKTSKSYEDLQKLTYHFPKAWFELSRLNVTDRIEFSSEFCLKTLPYSPDVYPLINDFFQNLEDICVIMTKKKNDNKYLVELVYSMQNDITFFRGKPPLRIERIRHINSQFNDILPTDFLAFFKIHNGFAKNADTGIIEAENLFEFTDNMHDLIENQQKSIFSNQRIIDPKDLIFFYQSYQKFDFQCFLTRWFPYSEVGNVYYSYNDNMISDYKNKMTWAENLAFPTFLDWLIFYLEIMDFE